MDDEAVRARMAPRCVVERWGREDPLAEEMADGREFAALRQAVREGAAALFAQEWAKARRDPAVAA